MEKNDVLTDKERVRQRFGGGKDTEMGDGERRGFERKDGVGT
jgi:hypothetical protein